MTIKNLLSIEKFSAWLYFTVSPEKSLLDCIQKVVFTLQLCQILI